MVEEADPQRNVRLLHSVGHVQVAHVVSHKDHVVTALQTLEVRRRVDGVLVFVVHVDHLVCEADHFTLWGNRGGGGVGAVFTGVDRRQRFCFGLYETSK